MNSRRSPVVYEYNGGSNPQIAVARIGGNGGANVLVEVHNGGSAVSGPLWYRTAVLIDDFDLVWNNSFPFETSGLNPSVTVFSDGTVVVVDQSNGQLRQRSGTLSADFSTISFASPTVYSSGQLGKIASWGRHGIGANGIEVHMNSTGVGTSQVVYGADSNTSMTYSASNYFPSVAIVPVVVAGNLDNPFACGDPSISSAGAPNGLLGLWTIEIHNTGNGFSPEYYQLGRWACGEQQNLLVGVPVP